MERQEIIAAQERARENQLQSLQSELSAARLHADQLQRLLEDDSELHPSNKQAQADRAELVKARKELSRHAQPSRELDKAKAINDKSIGEYHALTRSVADWKRGYGSLQKQLADKTKENATLSADCAKKDKELESFREGNYYDEFSDETHHTRQNYYMKENTALCSEIEELRKTILKCQGDLED